MHKLYDGISGNITIAISDHLAQFLIISEATEKNAMNTTIYKRDYSNLDREIFTLDLLDIEWDRVIPKEISIPNESFNLFFNKID